MDRKSLQHTFLPLRICLRPEWPLTLLMLLLGGMGLQMVQPQIL